MPPPAIPDLPTPPIEHHYTLDKYGKPLEIQSVIYLPPSDQEQFHELTPCDQQLDFLEQVIKNTEVRHVAVSLNKMRRKLFRENGLLKKRMAQLEHENQEIRHELDHLYHILSINKQRIHKDSSDVYTE